MKLGSFAVCQRELFSARGSVERKGYAPVSEVALRNLLTAENPIGLAEDRMRELVRDLHRANPTIYWIDLVLSATLGWAPSVRL